MQGNTTQCNHPLFNKKKTNKLSDWNSIKKHLSWKGIVDTKMEIVFTLNFLIF